jgi:hypothetical protein
MAPARTVRPTLLRVEAPTKTRKGASQLVQRSSKATMPLWWVLAIAVPFALAWSLARRIHAVRRFSRERTGVVDRDAALGATQRLRSVCAGCALGATICVGISIVELDHQLPVLTAITLGLAAWALSCVHATWRAHRALHLLLNPDVDASTDGRAYIFLSHGGDLLRFVALPRKTIAQVSRDLPAARIVS